MHLYEISEQKAKAYVTKHGLPNPGEYAVPQPGAAKKVAQKRANAKAAAAKKKEQEG